MYKSEKNRDQAAVDYQSSNKMINRIHVIPTAMIQLATINPRLHTACLVLAVKVQLRLSFGVLNRRAVCRSEEYSFLQSRMVEWSPAHVWSGFRILLFTGWYLK